MKGLLDNVLLTLAFSFLYQANTAFFQLFMELIDTWQPLSLDTHNPNIMRIIWHIVFFVSVLLFALTLMCAHPVGRKMLFVNQNVFENETININTSGGSKNRLKTKSKKKKQFLPSETESTTT